MICPNCQTWNPDDKLNCWRCQTQLPSQSTPAPKRQLPANLWIWIVVGFVVLGWLIVLFFIR